MVHDVKIWPKEFELLWTGVKEFEIRKNDRNYKAGDSLLLREWDPRTNEYTGRTMEKRITYVVQGLWGLPTWLCVMQLR